MLFYFVSKNTILFHIIATVKNTVIKELTEFELINAEYYSWH